MADLVRAMNTLEVISWMYLVMEMNSNQAAKYVS